MRVATLLGVSLRYVDQKLHGIRLEDFLEREWPDVDRADLRRAVNDECVVVNGLPAGPRQRLAPGDRVELQATDRELRRFRRSAVRPAEPEIAVLFEDARALVVDKPAGEPTIPDRGGKYQGVYGRLCAARADQDLRVVHRLDQHTSGCLMFAKDLETAREIDAAFRAGAVHKEYAALVEGVVRSSRIEIAKHLGPDPARPGKITVVREGARGARAAHTVAEVAERFRDHTLLRVKPTTGRSHQIRVHLRHRGYPIVADRDYGRRRALLLSEIKSDYKQRRGSVERPLLDRMFLHAAAVELTLADGSRIEARAPLPRDLQLVLDKLRRFSARGGARGCV